MRVEQLIKSKPFQIQPSSILFLKEIGTYSKILRFLKTKFLAVCVWSQKKTSVIRSLF